MEKVWSESYHPSFLEALHPDHSFTINEVYGETMEPPQKIGPMVRKIPPQA